MCLTIQKMIQYMIRKIGHPLHDMYPGLINMLPLHQILFRNYNLPQLVQLQLVKGLLGYWRVSLVFKLLK